MRRDTFIDARRTGAFISKLRKSKDWTQLDLAERLNMTNQAVSRWENGDSYPDIATLPRIAALFNITVDDLLYGERDQQPPRHEGVTPGAVVQQLSLGQVNQVARMVREDPSSIESVIDVAPLARPSMLEGMMQELTGITFTREQIEGLAPFLDQEPLAALVINADTKEIDGEYLSALAPFLRRETLQRLVASVDFAAVDPDWLEEIAPFLDAATLDTLVTKIEAGQMNASHISHLAPFLNRATLGRLVDATLSGKIDGSYLEELAPFIDRESLDRLVERVETGELTNQQVVELAPFLSQAALLKIIRITASKPMSADMIVELAPFIDKATLGELIRRAARAE